VGPFEIVALRILLALAFCAILLTVTRSWRALWNLVRQPRVLGIMAIAGVLIYVNWQVYIFAILSGHVVEGALGYFINPLVTVALGVGFLRERLRPAQWAALGLALVAILIIAIGLRVVPVDRPHARLLVRAVRLHQEARRRPGRRGERSHARDRAA
jgi:chloramphenicol-sensitive protein RarD